MAKCSPCISEEFKDAIKDRFNNPHVSSMVDAIPSCQRGMTIQLCPGKTSKEKRAPSEYNLFVKDCMQSKHLKGFDPGAMKDCAAQWKTKKK
jgi:hypothetical protein